MCRRLGQKVFSKPGNVDGQKVEEGWRDSIYRCSGPLQQILDRRI